ncbi:MAG: glutamate--cysteine ligase [Deltaproteobacteria bacterium]|nr:glutamate--cysteine ligase [Deltaproteobacteria bacterium]
MKIELQHHIEKNLSKVEEWMKKHLKKVKHPLYSSVDLRDAGYKIAPVDHNVFSGGFNNLTEKSKVQASQYFKEALHSLQPGIQKIGIFPETHTSNKFYLDNVLTLKSILEAAQCEVYIITTIDLPHGAQEFPSFSKGVMKLHQVFIQNNKATVENIFLDMIILNNDLSNGPIEMFKSLDIPLLPPQSLGWYQRKKSSYLEAYHKLAYEFSELIDVDPWFLSTIHERVEEVSFKEQKGMDLISKSVEKVLGKIRKKFEKHHIKRQPYVFLKNNSGTYGMGVLALYSPDDVYALNRGQRQEMSYGKSKKPITDIIIQEGVPTSKIIGDCIGEPVMYVVNGCAVGGFVRVHCDKTDIENLNVRGMTFKPFDCDEDPIGSVYGLISVLSSLAVGYEVKQYP